MTALWRELGGKVQHPSHIRDYTQARQRGYTQLMEGMHTSLPRLATVVHYTTNHSKQNQDAQCGAFMVEIVSPSQKTA